MRRHPPLIPIVVTCVVGLLVPARPAGAQDTGVEPQADVQGPSGSASEVDPAVGLESRPAPTREAPEPSTPQSESSNVATDASVDAQPPVVDVPVDHDAADHGTFEDDALDLLLEEEMPAQGPELDIYGFADTMVRFVNPFRGDTSWDGSPGVSDSFLVGGLNLYLASQIAEVWSSLIEVRFHYVPTGSFSVGDDGVLHRFDATARDPADPRVQFSWGGIQIERAFIEYEPHRLLSVRAGHWLTPYGIWNVDHGSPTIIGIERPYLVGDELFPRAQTGIQVHGDHAFGDSTLGYHLTLSNGRGPVSATEDLDRNKAVGGRLFVENRSFGVLTVGLSSYLGRYTDDQRRFRVDPATGETYGEVDVTAQYDELAFAADLRFALDGFLLQVEAVYDEIAYTQAGRPPDTLDPTRLLPDTRRWGGYALVGYRFDWMGLMPYAMVEHTDFGASNPVSGLSQALIPAVDAFLLGLNARPEPTVTLKLQLGWYGFPGSPPTSPGRDNLYTLGAQVAWSF